MVNERMSNEVSNDIMICQGVRQDYLLPPILFNLNSDIIIALEMIDIGN